MTWFKVDDGLAFHAKVVAAGNPAMGLWVRAGAWCAQQLTNGHVPTHMVTTLGRNSEAKRLVEAGLWREADDGFVFWQWDERNPSREEVEEDRAAARERMRKARDARRSVAPPTLVRPNFERTSPAVAVTPTRPVPTRPTKKREPDGFADWYLAYPRKTARGRAADAYSKALTKTDAPTLLSAVEKYRDARKGQDPQFTPHPATWLNDERWQDEAAPALTNADYLRMRVAPPGSNPHMAHLWEQA